ncbi:MAG: hydrogenase maturation protease [Chthoniobacter sp.]|nr:hydrogenase maturation protease [Chthoniobacter sp.]
MNRTVVIGVGNEFRGDDGVGRIVARRLAERKPDGMAVNESTGEALSLMELWGDAARVILVDAAEVGGEPGAVHRLDASVQALPSAYFHTSTHAFSVAEAVEMARSLGQLPPKVIVYGIQGASFGHGDGLTPEAQRGADEALRLILAEISAHNP